MNDMKKLLAVLLALSLLAVCLAACGGSGVKTSAADIAKAIEGSAGLVNPTAVTEDDLVYTMTLTMDNIEEYAGSYSNATGASGTVLVVKAKSGKADAVKAELETYKTANAELMGNYTEFATSAQQAKDGRIVVKDNVVVLVIAGPEADYAAIDTAVENAVK